MSVEEFYDFPDEYILKRNNNEDIDPTETASKAETMGNYTLY